MVNEHDSHDQRGDAGLKNISDIVADNSNNESQDIDLFELLSFFWSQRVSIIRYSAIGVIFGLIIALTMPKEYRATATLMPEYSVESQGAAAGLLEQYGGLIGLSGGSYTSNSNAIRVELYPKIVESLPLMISLMEEEFYYPDYDTTAPLYDYFFEIHSSGFIESTLKWIFNLPFAIKNEIFGVNELETPDYIANKSFINISKDQMNVIYELRSRVVSVLDEETGVISVRAEMPNPYLSAAVAEYTVNQLTNYLTEYRTEKVMLDLEFVEEQLIDAKTRFQSAQLKLAEFRDSNQGALTEKAKTEEEILRREYDLAFNIYNTLSQQYEQSKLKVQEETPIFKVLQPVQVPVEDTISGMVILIAVTFFAFTLKIIHLIIQFFLSGNK